MKTAASPTKLCSAATSWGISVIWTRWATKTPAAAPSASMTSTTSGLPTEGDRKVASTASAMPTMPYQIARLALSWLARPPSERMNRTAAAT